MKKTRTGSMAGEVLASPPVATVQVPLPLLDVLTETRTAFFSLCLYAGQQVLHTMMEQDREQLCGPKHVPNPARRAVRGGSTRGEVTLGGRRILVPRLRARSVDGHELTLPSFAYAAGRDPLDARTLEAIAIGVTTRKYHRALDPLPSGTPAPSVSLPAPTTVRGSATGPARAGTCLLAAARSARATARACARAARLRRL
jgi:putative transposase